MVLQVRVPEEHCYWLTASARMLLLPSRPLARCYESMLSCSDTWPRDKAAVLRFIHISRGHSGA